MKGFSVIMPYDGDREKQFKEVFEAYVDWGFPKDVEFILVSRKLDEPPFKHPKLKLIKYVWEGEFFNPSMALNIGVKVAKFNNVVITCPEVYPVSNVLKDLGREVRGNYVCKVFDERKNGDTSTVLVSSVFRCDDPSMYFLSCFKKEDLEELNGWDEDFMGGYAWEDSDFGVRFNKAGLGFVCLDYVTGLHLYHPRLSMNVGWSRNKLLFEKSKERGVFRCVNGLVKE
ncbi:MAG: hypothetical protein DRJ15_12575 [Bacteroidetes bacterium]|nr:MAG: hypothetical protein DRJ15_12575 [Bacteroidota bacterium]